MLHKLALPEVKEMLDSGEHAALAEAMRTWLPADLAGILSQLADNERLRLFTVLATHRAAETFEYLDLATQQELLASLPDGAAAALLNEMAPDDRTALFAELPLETSARLLPLLSAEQQAVTRSLLNYVRDTVGRLMTPDYIAVRKEWTVKHVLDHVRAHGRDSETLNVVYVVDHENRLIDDLRIRELLLAPLHEQVAHLLDGQFISLHATDLKKKAVDVFRKYDRTALPVIDAHGMLVGIVTIDDVLDVAEQEATRNPAPGRARGAGRPLRRDAVAGHGAQTGLVAGGVVSQRIVDGHGNGFFRGRNRAGRGAGAVCPADHFQRRQFGLAGGHADRPCPGAGGSAVARLVARAAARVDIGFDAGSIVGNDRLFADRADGVPWATFTGRTGC